MVLRVIRNHSQAIASLCLLAYIVIVHILFIFFLDDKLYTSYNGLLFVYKFNAQKYIFCLLSTGLIYFLSLNHIKRDTFTDFLLLFLYCLYFVPGFVQQAVTDADWGYMIFYFLFFLGMEFWSRKLKPHTYSNLAIYVPSANYHTWIKVVSFLVFLSSLFILAYNHTAFSISNLVETLADVYGVRAEAKLRGTHWLILTVEYWSIYVIALLVSYYTSSKKWLWVVLLSILGISLFLIQANRIFLFVLILAFMTGVLRFSGRKLAFFMSLFSIASLVEVNLLQFDGIIITDVFRRFSIVPNKISEFYYDYFIYGGHELDFWRSSHTRIFALFGISSPYEYSPIGNIIGNNYFGWDVNCNTGMVGGSVFDTGILAPIVSTFGYVMFFRLFEGCTYTIRNSSMWYMLAMLFATLSINAPGMLASIFSLSYFLLLYITFLPLAKKKVQAPFENVVVNNQ